VQRVDVLAGDRLDGDVVDIELVFPNEEEEQVERAFKDGELDAVVGVGNHGAGEKVFWAAEARCFLEWVLEESRGKSVASDTLIVRRVAQAQSTSVPSMPRLASAQSVSERRIERVGDSEARRGGLPYSVLPMVTKIS